jgi:hypothetical protein
MFFKKRRSGVRKTIISMLQIQTSECEQQTDDKIDGSLGDLEVPNSSPPSPALLTPESASGTTREADEDGGSGDLVPSLPGAVLGSMGIHPRRR